MAAAAAATTLSYRHIFGVNTNVADNISFTDEDTIVYVAGHSLVLYNIVDKRQRFIQSAEITDSITAYTSGPGKRLCAVAEKGERPSFHIFDLRTFRRKKTITTSDLQTKEIVSLQFSEDNQLLLALSGSPDWTLMCWNWAKAKLIASIVVSIVGVPVYHCMFSPLDASVCTVIGKDCVKFFRIGEKEMRPLQENIIANNNFTAFCWMRTPDDHLLVGTDEGKILLFRSGEFLLHLPSSPGPRYPIMSLASIPGGFIAGSGPGQFFFYHYDESKDQALFDTQFSLVNSVCVMDLSMGNITALAVCPKDENLCALTSDGQLLSVSVVTTAAIQTENVTYMISPFHGPKPITGMDVALRKPLILTCSKDSSLRLWNFQHHRQELCKVFPEEMYSVAIHPTGLHCAVGFTDKLRVYHILVDDLRLCMEVPIKGCRDCRFHNGGHLLAAANGNSICVYDFYSGEKIADLRGHNSKVRNLHWLPSGFQLLTCGQDGAVYVWSIDGAKRTGEFVQKGTVYTSAVNTVNSVLVVGNDRSLRELSLPDLAPNKLHDAGLVLTHTAISTLKTVLFASTYEMFKPGYVRAYSYPVTGDFDDYPCTNSQILRMRLTPDENFLVVADEQGCMVLLELKGRQDRFQRNNPSAYCELTVLPEWSDEVMVTRAELDDCHTTVAELEIKVVELRLNNDYQLKIKDMSYVEKIKETTDKFVAELELAKNRLEMLQEVRVDYEIESIEKLKYMEEMHQNNVQNLETGFQAQIMEMVDSYQQLVRNRDAQIERLDEQRRQLVATHEVYVNELTRDFESKLDEDRHARLQNENEKHELERDLAETQNQLEDDIDTEIENMRRVNEDKLALSRETTLKYKGENGIMKKKYILMQRDIEDQKEEMKALQAKEKELHEQIKILEKEVSAHKKEIKTRDLSIGEKEKRIYELKKKNQELDKFKFVLDFKIRELKEQIEPRQMEIMAMRDKIKSMDNDLEKFHNSNSALDSLIGDLRLKIDSLQQESKTVRTNAKTLENTIATCRSDVQTSIKFIQTPALLLQAVTAIVEKYGGLENIRPRVDPEVQEEYNRHKEFLQKSILDLKRSVEADAISHMTVNNAIRESNMKLIHEINSQRDINKQLKMTVQADIGRIRHLAQASNSKRGKAGAASGKGTPSLPNILGSAPPTGNNNDKSPRGLQAIALGGSGVLNNDPHGGSAEFMEPTELLEKNRRRIMALRAAIAELENRTGGVNLSKAYSREVLPPMDNGVSGLPAVYGAQPSGREQSGGGAAQQKQSYGIALPQISAYQGMGDSIVSENGSPVTRRDIGNTYTTEYDHESNERNEAQQLQQLQEQQYALQQAGEGEYGESVLNVEGSEMDSPEPLQLLDSTLL